MIGLFSLSGEGPDERDEEGRALLDQPTRRQIMDVIEALPGIKISDVCEETDSAWGTVQHHLHLLEKAGLVESRSPGRARLLFPHDFPEDDLPVAEVLGRGRAGDLALQVLRTPGTYQTELCEAMDTTRKVVRRYVNLLTDAGLIEERSDNPYKRYYPTDELLSFVEQHASERWRDQVEGT